MYFKVFSCYLALFVLVAGKGWAHPVIYKDGWVYSAEFRPKMNLQNLSYTFHPHFAVEANTTEFEKIDGYRDYKFGFNALLKRWYLLDSQANIYLSAQAGYFNQELNKDGSVLHGMVMGDWESRRLYTAASVMWLAFDGHLYPKYSYRLGLAPYIAGMDTLQSWLIFQIGYFEADSKIVDLTPMLRFFYKNVLWEMGSNLDGELFLAMMVHY